jgi:hypothetical protein
MTMLTIGTLYLWENLPSKLKMLKSSTSLSHLSICNGRKIKDNQYDFPTTNPISEEAQNLITSLLCPDPTNRPSIDEISDHKFFHIGDMPREIPSSTLYSEPHWDRISKPMSELNWRYISVQAGLGKNIKVGQDAGKSVQVCIAANENPLKGHVARLQQEERGLVKGNNVLPMTLSPRVPAPAVGGLTEGRLMAKGAKRSIKKVPSEEDKENDLPAITTGKKGTIGKKRTAVQQVFAGIPEEANEDPVKPRRMSPPLRKPSGSIPTTVATTKTNKVAPVVSLPTVSQRIVPHPEPEQPTNDLASSGPKRTLRGVKAPEYPSRLPTQAELNVPSRVPPRIHAQRTTLKRTITQDNLKQVTPSKSILIAVCSTTG